MNPYNTPYTPQTLPPIFPPLSPYLIRAIDRDSERRARDGRTLPPTVRHFSWEGRV